VPLLDLGAVDFDRLPRDIIESSSPAQYHVLVLGKAAPLFHRRRP
jgi:hypothetical protein